MKKSVPEVAEELAKAHVVDDPKTTDIFFVVGVDDEVRLVEVSGSLGDTTGPGEVLPVRFNAQEGIPYPSVVVLLSKAEWTAVQSKTLKLPVGWEMEKLKKVV
jgi:hypothetical protein